MLQELESFEPGRAKAARRLIGGFPLKTVEALRNSLWSAHARAGSDERLRYPIIIAIGLLQSWAYRWRERLGPNEFPDDPPGLYRKNSLSLFAKARKLVRIAETPSRQVHLQTMVSTNEMQKPETQPTAKPTKQARRLSRAELLQDLDRRLASTTRRRDAATGDERISLTMEVAAILMEIDSVDRRTDFSRDEGVTPKSAPARSQTETRPPAKSPPLPPTPGKPASELQEINLAHHPTQSAKKPASDPTRDRTLDGR